MKNKFLILFTACCLIFICNTSSIYAQADTSFKELKGKIIDSNTNEPLIFADLVINNTNISTISNSDGDFILKVPESFLDGHLTISRLGYHKKELKISTIGNNEKIDMEPTPTQLDVIQITLPKDAKSLFLAALKNKSTLYNNSNTEMTAFYRETIKKRRKNASLSEAVVQIQKQPYNSFKKDGINLIKARKNTNYSRLDTIALKLQGGPFGNLYTDIMKYPEFIFTDEDIELYDFSFAPSTQIDENLVYVVNFKQKPHVITPLYYGKLYIDAKNLALTSAVYSLNVENKTLSSQMFVRKKPRKVDVYPTEANYRVNYRTQNGKWHYAYSNILLTFKVNWKGKLFNSVYTLNSEMAITDWKISDSKFAKNVKSNRLHPTTILIDQVSGFSDPQFWGEYNIIEPEKSIESAIKKIQRQLKRS
ncbi:carboxypeptidase-like regulatory domain-containing protein [Snuella sedimenti]|uniref:Carboxypeptidase-like regulatory domain-containing protein n=1 Tax=Snuella sedimenti TaxID=2798802 RepID=A0A8J7IFH6_9FLAO|nr:carboxypeptidase-like regulatory domain-containing protein [Snuella sedimenti]MBJ6367862.1 carboxypeptidase-like regulatory domain-containing protein [Snuella sedimenti]